MRMRKKKHRDERLDAVSHLFAENGKEYPKDKKLFVEIGCGKGAFLRGLARREEDAFLFALEKMTDVILLAAESAEKEEIGNVRFLNADAKALPELFEPHSVDRIYLNFSDPWPKAGHYKRRLTYRAFLALYREVLKENGEVFFKTDNRLLFDFSLAEFRADGWDVKNVTYDLHHSEWKNDNIETEYEANFSAKGFSICRLEAVCIPKEEETPAETDRKTTEKETNAEN